MDEANFTRCVVAFLDILGFKDFIEAAEHSGSHEFRQFCALQEAIRSQLHYTQAGSDDREQHLFPAQVGLQVLHISDSFILSAPVRTEECPNYSGMVAVAIKSIQLAHQLLKMGFLVRGGLAVGNLHRTESNVFGTGYQTAYETEKCAATPRVLFHQSAVEHFEAACHMGRQIWGFSIFAQEGDDVMLDTLAVHWSYVGAESGADVAPTFRSHKEMIEQQLSRLPSGRAREKWEWMAKYFSAKQKNSSELASVGPIQRDEYSLFRFGPLITHSDSTLKEARESFYAPDSRHGDSPYDD